MKPIIFPLQKDPPRWSEEGTCGCNHCRHWSPLIETLRLQLDKEGNELLQEYINYIEQRAEDGGVAEAKLAGTWPGWEKIKEFKPEK